MNTITRTLAATALAVAVQAGTTADAASPSRPAPAATAHTPSTITTADGVQLYYKDWGPKDGPVVTFSHGWPLDSDSWDPQMMFLASKGYRASSRTTAAATVVPASRGTATTWTTTPTTWPR